jgi:hypothetical protein
MKINKFAFKLSALAVAALSSAGAFATGSITAPASTVVYAEEGIYATAITLPLVTYQMGVGRGTTGQDMTIIYTLPTGTSFASLPTSLTYSTPDTNITPTVTSTIKRGGVGQSQVVYSVSIGTQATAAGDTFTLGATTSVNAGLLTPSSTLGLEVKLLDQVETACVDNVGTPAVGTGECKKSVVYGSLAPAADFWNNWPTTPVVGVAADSGETTTDALATRGPLTGFVEKSTGALHGAVDMPTTASASVRVKTTTANVMSATDPTAAYTLVAGDEVTITVTDPTGMFAGLAADGLLFSGDVTSTTPSGDIFVASGSDYSVTLPGDSESFGAGTASGVVYTADGVTSMGIGRVLGISGAVAPADGIGHSFTGRTDWWTWGSNGIILETPMTAVTSGYNNRYVFMNYGLTDATMTAECLVESGKTVVSKLLQATPATLLAGKQTVLLTSDVCTVTPGTEGNQAQRAGVRFTISAPANTVKGVYNAVSPTGSIDSIEMLPVRSATNPV